MQLSIATTDDIRTAVREEIATFFSSYQIPQQLESDEIGKGAEFASKVTGKAIPTIYALCHKRLIPHSKRGNDLYFSKHELQEWIRSGRRKTQAEISVEAEAY